ncbi:MAG: PAS domain S-box protein, partial [Candidatus Moraniibacteriota bacterium]
MTSLPLITLFDQLPGGLLVTDLTSRILYANQAVSQRTGYALPEIIGKKPGELWGGRMPRSFYDFLWQTIGREGKPFVGRFENKPKKGERRLETLQIAPIKNGGGVTEYFEPTLTLFRLIFKAAHKWFPFTTYCLPQKIIKASRHSSAPK